MVQDVARRCLKGFTQLPHDVLQGNYQGQFRVIEDLQIPDQILVKLVDPFPNFMEGEARLFQQQQIPLNSAWGGLEILAQPRAGDLLFLHEDPEDLTQSNNTRFSINLFRHFPTLQYVKILRLTYVV